MLQFNQVEYKTAVGESKEVILEDGSKITLLSNSSISLKKLFWLDNREVELDGKAFFEITSGPGFRVNLAKGIVEVLGTEFEILSNTTFTRVKCFEGQVKTTFGTENKSLKAGKGLTVSENNQIDLFDFNPDKTELYEKEYQVFIDSRLLEVLSSFEIEYGFKFQYDKAILSKRFTGRFPKNNMGLALRMIVKPLGLIYTVDGLTIILKEAR